jgi:hypothetical protein
MLRGSVPCCGAERNSVTAISGWIGSSSEILRAQRAHWRKRTMTAPVGQLPASVTAADVLAFTKLFGLTDAPAVLGYHDAGYDADWCHVSAKHHAITNGGRRIHGWALWQYDGLVMGDFHSVWEDGDKLVDVTPPKFGGSQVMFVRDRVTDIYEMQGVIVLPTNRTSLRQTPFYWEGQPTTEQIWGLLPTEPALVAYCAKLGFAVGSIVTEQAAG